MPGQNLPTDPKVTADPVSFEVELSRLCGVNGITSSNQTSFINAMTDAQVAAFVRRWLITAFKIIP